MIDLSPILALGLVLVRPGTLIMTAPQFGGVFAPTPVKVGLTVFLTLALFPVAPAPIPGSAVGMVLIVTREMSIGLALSLGARVLLAAAEFGGHLAGFQMGLSYAAIVDPTSGVRNNVLATLYSNIAMVTFLLTNVHHAFLRALRDSYQMLPIGTGQIGQSLPGAVTGLLGMVFLFGVRLAAPLVIVLLVTELAIGLVSRSAPALNLGVVAGPIRLLLGLVLLGFVTPAAVGVMHAFSTSLLQAGVKTAEAFR